MSDINILEPSKTWIIH